MVTSIAMLAETPVIYLLLPVMRENVKKMDLLKLKMWEFLDVSPLFSRV